MNTSASVLAATAAKSGVSGADLLGRLETETRRQLESDFEALREREANLQRYEARLRTWQEQLDGRSASKNSGGMASSDAPFGGTHSATATDSEICAAWDKFHRARALLQAEQNQLRDERMAFRDAKADMDRREADITTRETRLAERELLLKIAVGATTEDERKSPSAMKRLTSAPLSAAKSVFGGAPKPNPA